MKYTDYLCVVFFKNGTYHQFAFSANDWQKVKDFELRGQKYHVDIESAFQLHGDWTPWIRNNQWLPWSIIVDSTKRLIHKVGLLIFREPDTISETPVLPSTKSAMKGVLTPREFRSLTKNPVYATYRKKQRFGTKKGGLWMWVLVGFILIIFVLYMTGVITI